jgi:hypothetical protein
MTAKEPVNSYRGQDAPWVSNTDCPVDDGGKGNEILFRHVDSDLIVVTSLYRNHKRATCYAPDRHILKYFGRFRETCVSLSEKTTTDPGPNGAIWWLRPSRSRGHDK